MRKHLDQFLNSITMYRLMTYGLFLIAMVAMVSAVFGRISFSPFSMAIAFFVLLITCELSNRLLARLFGAIPNTESAYITGFLLFFVLEPQATSWRGAGALVLAGALAMGSKYVFAIRNRHVFNPVAITAVLFNLIGINTAIWWVATPVLLPFVLVFGMLVVRKIRRFHQVWPFLVLACAIAFMRDIPISTFFLSWPLVFFGTLMLTEPRTAPSRTRDQMIYGATIGVLFASPFALGQFALTPELALVIGNLFAYAVSSKRVLTLKLLSKQQRTPSVYEFAFATNNTLSFSPGQYLEWTLPVAKPDRRGNRRYFTIASSPTDAEIHLGVRVDQAHGSRFKQTLMEMHEGDIMRASHLSGEFVLPKDQNVRLVFVAGGIGITPFRSMIRWLCATNQKRDIVLFYAAQSEQDFAFKDEFDAVAESIGLKIFYLPSKPSPTWKGKIGYLTQEMILSEVSDPLSRIYYFSGPPAMVENYVKLATSMGVHPSHIKTDYFPGF